MSSSMTSTTHPYRAFSKLTQHRSSAALGSSRVVAPTPRVRIRARASSVVVRANWIKDAFFKSAEEKALAEFATSDAGKKAIEFAAANKGGGMDLILAFGKKEAGRGGGAEGGERDAFSARRRVDASARMAPPRWTVRRRGR